MTNFKIPFFAACLLAVASASAQVSITVGQPGFYGRVDIGGMAAPPVIYREPLVIERPVRMVREPLYLRVPPGHAKNWRKHCGKYNACGRRVLFVRDDWYLNDYAPRYRAEHRGRHDGRDHGDRHGGHERRGDDHDRRRDDHRDQHGPGRGHGNGNGHNNGHNNGHGRD
ncbi:MAG TPA: hypothetical protein VF774_01520 [Pseudoduganella sp.]